MASLFICLLPLGVRPILSALSALVSAVLPLVTRMLLMQVGGFFVELRGTVMSFFCSVECLA